MRSGGQALDSEVVYGYSFDMKKQPSAPLTFTLQVFREGKLFVAYNPELDVSSCGNSVAEAKENLFDAVRGFLKSAHKHKTLHTILEEAGYSRIKDRWTDPELLALDRFSVSV